MDSINRVIGLGWVIGKDLDKLPWNKINTIEAKGRKQEKENESKKEREREKERDRREGFCFVYLVFVYF